MGTSYRVQPGENRQGRRAEVITTITQRMKHPIAKIRKTQSQSSGKHQVAAIRGFYCARDLNKTQRQQKFLSTVHAGRNYPARKGNLTPPPFAEVHHSRRKIGRSPSTLRLMALTICFKGKTNFTGCTTEKPHTRDSTTHSCKSLEV